MKNLYLIRGVSGAGKSTFAKVLADSLLCPHLEADMFFIDANGEYNFNQTLLKEAHNWCKNKTEVCMEDCDNIVVSNTFTQEWEMKPYFDLAEKYGFRVITLIVENRHKGKSIHNVPTYTILNQMKRFEVEL